MRRTLVPLLVLSVVALLAVVTSGAAPSPGDLKAPEPKSAAEAPTLEPPACGTLAEPDPEPMASPKWTFEGCFAYVAAGPCFDVYRDSSGTLWICKACGTTKKPGPGSCQVLTAPGFWCS